MKDYFDNPNAFLKNDTYLGLSRHLNQMLSTFKQKRTCKEQQWVKNQNQYDGIYEAEIKKNFKPGKSQVFSRVTTAKVDQSKSQIMNLVIPNGDKNFALAASPNAQLPRKTLQQVLDLLQQQAFENQQQITREDIEIAIREISQQRAEKMEKTILDQFMDAGNYMQVISNVILSAHIYGCGIIKGPFNKMSKQTVYKQDQFGRWIASEKEMAKPYIEHVKVWDAYFDLDAKDFNSDEGAFFTHVFTRNELNKLIKRPDFIKENIKDFIQEFPNGNYKKEPYETQLQSTGNENNDVGMKNKYRLVEYWGTVPAKLLKDVKDQDDQLLLKDHDDSMMDVEVCVWFLNDVIIKCMLNPYDSQRRPYRVFNYRTTDAMLLGTGLCCLLETDQRALNAVVRAIHDNMAYIAGPMFEVNHDLIVPGTSVTDFFPGKIIHREGLDASAGYPAVKPIVISNEVQKLMALEASYREKMNDISNINQILSGDMSNQATVGRTSSGINSLLNNANLPFREIVRNFDFFNQYVISLYVEWNMMFNEDDTIKGDYDVVARVSTALIDKQLMSNNLNQLVMGLRPEQAPYINWQAVLDAQLRATNLDPQLIKLTPEAIAQNEQQQAQMAQQQQEMMAQQAQMEQAKVQSEIESKQSKSQAEMMKLENDKEKLGLERIKTLGGVEKSRAEQLLKEGQFTNEVMNEDHDRNNLTSQELSKIIAIINNRNPNTNIKKDLRG